MSDGAKRILIFAALMAWCAGLLFLRIVRAGTLTYVFLVWNLFLAAIPAAAAALFAISRSRLSQALSFVVWLLFLPNAPYIVTDFIHLTPRPPVPLWYDVALLLSFAGTGLLLGYSSISDVQNAIARRFGAGAGWTTAFAALLLSGFGIYLGRFLRWNSWDAITDPLDMLGFMARHAVHPQSHLRTLAVTMIYGIGLTLGYLAYQVPRLRMNMQSP
ncbi:MAG TPA: DUF1361 domain-containing protein [Thermoanaerobaculia bacterium]|nr:DUF1361 domain-containing protein [Thermoanaerobaculia bacterium]